MIISEQPHLAVAAATHPGMKGKSNEDRYSVTAYRSTAGEAIPSVLAILADGIGGHRAGEVAAQLAIDNISKYIANSPLDQPTMVLKQALIHTNQLIHNFSDANQALAGMGTTCVCAWVIADRLYAASVGDSRLYLQRGAELSRLTTDHTWIQEALAQGTITTEQAKGHPNAHIIRRFLGSMNVLDPDFRLRLDPSEDDRQAEANQGLRLIPGDRLLLCTDGLTDLVQDVEILEMLRARPFEKSPAGLIELANQRGGHDNITVIALEVPPPPPAVRVDVPLAPPPVSPRQKLRRSATSWWMVGLLLLAIASMLLLLFYLSGH